MELPLLVTALASLALAERVPALRFAPLPFLRRYLLTDAFCLGTGALALGLVMRAQAARAALALGLPLAALDALPAPLAIALTTALYDLGAYASHVLLHRFEPLWRLHKVHHSSRALDWLATFRAHALEHALRHLLSPVALLLLGFPLYAVAAATALHTAWAVFVHSNLRLDLAFLEPVFITPRLHRLHHVAATSEFNLGSILSLWDRLRGTLVTRADAAHEPLGVPGEIESYPQSWLPQLIEPWRRRESSALSPLVR